MRNIKDLTLLPTHSVLITLAVISFSLTFSVFSEETSIPANSSDTSQSIQEELRWLQAEGMVKYYYKT